MYCLVSIYQFLLFNKKTKKSENITEVINSLNVLLYGKWYLRRKEAAEKDQLLLVKRKGQNRKKCDKVYNLHLLSSSYQTFWVLTMS